MVLQGRGGVWDGYDRCLPCVGLEIVAEDGHVTSAHLLYMGFLVTALEQRKFYSKFHGTCS